jgi:uncharacterized protein (TIGR01777 family)
MKIAFTGGTGFIGRPLVDRLLAAGHTIILLSRRPEAAPRREGLEASFFDVERPLGAGALRGVSVVIHLAGEPIATRWTPDRKRRIRQSRVTGTLAVVQAAREAGTVGAFLCASGVGYYGARGAEPLTEASPPGDDFLAQVCRDWEGAARSAAGAGIRTVILRLGAVLHPEGGALAKMLPLFRLGLGGRIGSGTQYLSWIHREDVLGLAMHALETASLEGAMNVTAPEPVTNAEFTRSLARALGRPALLKVPAPALRVAFGEMSQTVLTGQRVLPQRATETGYTFRFPGLDGALRHLLIPRVEV